jgi:two-component system OmpR family response regulator
MTAKKSVLIVEDEHHLAVGIKYNLEAEGFQVTTAGDGPSALQCIENKTPIDLIILDLMLPGMSGYAVCEKLREMNIDVPVLILSARTLTEDRTRGFDVGADQYLTKPFDLDELISRVRSLLLMYDRRTKRGNGQPAFSPPQYQIANCEVDFATYEVNAGGKKAKLTQLEMKLLQYFIHNEGRVIPRDELLENVWEMPATITTRAVDQFIRRLRKIFEPNPSSPRHFLTIRDVGYRFVTAGVDTDLDV